MLVGLWPATLQRNEKRSEQKRLNRGRRLYEIGPINTVRTGCFPLGSELLCTIWYRNAPGAIKINERRKYRKVIVGKFWSSSKLTVLRTSTGISLRSSSMADSSSETVGPIANSGS